MKINNNNFWILMHEDFYDDKPKTLCGFFWKTIFVFLLWITSPISLIWSLVDSIQEKKIHPIAFSGILIVDKVIQFLALITVLSDDKNKNIDWIDVFIIYALTSLIMIIILFVVVIINKLITKIKQNIPKGTLYKKNVEKNLI